MNLGTWQVDDLLTFYVTTAVYATGAATDADSAPAYRVYEEETATPLLTGTMALLDSANTAGFYSEQITLSAANGFEIGKHYAIYLAYTVSSIAQATHHTFQVEPQPSVTAVGAPISTTASSATITTGTQSSGTYSNTVAADGSHHTIADSASALDMYYQFDVGGDGIGSGVSWLGYVNGANDTIRVYAYNWSGAAWEQIGTIAGKAPTTNDTYQWDITAAHTGTGANLGLIRIRFAGNGLTTATLNTDRLLLGYAVVNRSAGYVDGAVWLDTISGTAGTEPYVNGTADHPVNSLADARTLALALGLRNYHIIGGSTITLANSYSAALFNGSGWILNLGNQSISYCTIVGAQVSGTATGTDPTFLLCHISACTLPPCNIGQSHIDGTITLGSAGTYSFMRCMDDSGSGATPIIDFGSAVGATDVNLRKYAGGMEVHNMKAGDYLAADGMGRLIIAASCTGGEVRVRGTWDIENSGSGQTFTSTANSTPDSILDRADGVEDSYSLRQALRLVLAALAGKVNGAASNTITIRDVNDAIDRIVATVDADGNRSGVIYDVS